MKTFLPAASYVLLEPLKADDDSKGKILLPGGLGDGGYSRGRVLEVGPGEIGPVGALVPLQVSKGDLVLFAPQGTSSITVNGKLLVVISDRAILGTFTE